MTIYYYEIHTSSRGGSFRSENDEAALAHMKEKLGEQLVGLMILYTRGC